MTTLAALHVLGANRTIIGSDTQVTNAVRKGRRHQGKWVVENGWAIGCSGMLRAVNVIEYHASDIFANVSHPMEIGYRLREILRADGFGDAGEEDDAPVRSLGQYFLLANATGVWSISGDLAMVDITDDEMAGEGSGGEFVVAADRAASRVKKLSPVRRVQLALETACEFDPQSSAPIWMAELCESAERAVDDTPPGLRVLRSH